MSTKPKEPTQEDMSNDAQASNVAFLDELKQLLGKHSKGLQPALKVTAEGIVPVINVVDVTPEVPDTGLVTED